MINHTGFLFALVLTLPAAAEPEVIADFGGKATGLHTPKDQLSSLAKEQPIPALLARTPNDQRFPLQSKMRLGTIDRHTHDKPVHRPFFILGVDQHSVEWLQANRDYLHEINARGWVTNVNTEQDVETLREYAGAIPLDAIPVDSIADVFDLHYYPVLITQEEISQ